MGTFILKRKNYGLAMKAANPASIVADVAVENAVTRPAEAAIDTVNEVDSQRAAKAAQKQYGVAEIGKAVKEVGTGLGKGIWEFGKANKNTLGGAAAFSGALGAGGYAVNRIQRQREENATGERTTDGMSTGGKMVAGATAIGAGAGAAYATGRSHDKSLEKLNKTLERNKKILKESNPNSAIGKKMTQNITQNEAEIAKMGRKRLGGLVSNKSFKMGRNAVIAGGLMAGAGMLADSMLKQKNNSSFAAVGRLAKKALGGKTMTQAMKDGDWSNVGKAVGTYVTGGAKNLAKMGSNFFTPGNNGATKMVNTMKKSLASQGEYGKKAADFIGRHKTASMVVGAGTVGSAGYTLADKVGTGAVNAATSLDRKTAEYNKNQQEMMGGY